MDLKKTVSDQIRTTKTQYKSSNRPIKKQNFQMKSSKSLTKYQQPYVANINYSLPGENDNSTINNGHVKSIIENRLE